jgi:hypothetical protein
MHAAVLITIAGFLVAGCSNSSSSQDDSCPPALPITGTACRLSPQSSVPGAVPVCGYVTDTNACGAANCYCGDAGWSCDPTCVIDASIDQSVTDAPRGDASPVEDGADAGGLAVDGSDGDASFVDASGEAGK